MKDCWLEVLTIKLLYYEHEYEILYLNNSF